MRTQPAAQHAPSMRPRVGAALVVMAALLLSGCSARGPAADTGGTPPNPHAAGTSPGAAPFTEGPIALHFAMPFTEDGESYTVTVDVVAASPRSVRVVSVSPDLGRLVEVWDGQHILEHAQDGVFPYTLYEAPAEHPDIFGLIETFMIGDPTAGAGSLCKDAKRLPGTSTVLGRSAIAYRCTPTNDSFIGPKIVVDRATGLLLRSGPLQVSRVDTSPTITAATFSTQAPAGAKVDVIAAKHPTSTTPRQAPAFRVKLLAGGTVSSEELAGRPYVLEFFSSDLYFDSGELCPRCVPSLLEVQDRSHDGTDPTVLAVQNGERGKPGAPLVPKGLRLRIANDPDAAVQHAYGLTHLVGFAFVDSDGTILQIIDHPASSKELTDALSALN